MVVSLVQWCPDSTVCRVLTLSTNGIAPMRQVLRNFVNILRVGRGSRHGSRRMVRRGCADQETG